MCMKNMHANPLENKILKWPVPKTPGPHNPDRPPQIANWGHFPDKFPRRTQRGEKTPASLQPQCARCARCCDGSHSAPRASPHSPSDVHASRLPNKPHTSWFSIIQCHASNAPDPDMPPVVKGGTRVQFKGILQGLDAPSSGAAKMTNFGGRTKRQPSVTSQNSPDMQFLVLCEIFLAQNTQRAPPPPKP